MRLHIQTRGPRRLEVAFKHDGEEHRARGHVHDAISRLLIKLEHPQGGRFMLVACDPAEPDKYDSAMAIIDTLQDVHEPPLFRRLHRLAHLRARAKGAVVDSPEPPTIPGFPDAEEA